MKTYHVTSPNIKDDHVLAIQTQLQKLGYYHGALDSEYGILTSQAVFRAKYWLGYAKPDHVAGDLFWAYISGGKKPTLGMAGAARRRKKQQANTPIRVKMLTEAMRHIGVSESPAGSNKNPFGVWYGANGVPWCAEFVSYCGFQAGSKVFQPGHHYAYVPYIVADARRGTNYLTVTKAPQPGDLICYDWPGESPGTADHVGMFLHWNDEGLGTFTAIEGNTSATSNSNGGQVQIRGDRKKSEAQVFVHVGR